MTRFTNYQIRPARPEDVGLLAPRLREIDKREVRAMSGLEPGEALRVSLALSGRAWTAWTEDRVILMWGAGRLGGLPGLVGAPWMLASDILERPEVSREFIRQSRPYARELEKGFQRLINRVHAENHLAIRWLRWLGFSFGEKPERLGGEPFYVFWRDCGCVKLPHLAL